MNDRDFRKNSEGYYDPTAYQAIMNADRDAMHCNKPIHNTSKKHEKDVVFTGATNIHDMATDCIQTIETLQNQLMWVPVEQCLPTRPDYDWVLVKTQFVPEGGLGVPHVAELRNGVWYCDCCDGPMEEILGIKVIAWFDMQLIKYKE